MASSFCFVLFLKIFQIREKNMPYYERRDKSALKMAKTDAFSIWAPLLF